MMPGYQAPFTGAQVDDAISRSLGRYEVDTIDELIELPSHSWNKAVIVWENSNGSISTYKWKSGGEEAHTPDLYIRPSDFTTGTANSGLWEQRS